MYFSHLSYTFLCHFLPLFIPHFFHSFIFVRIVVIFRCVIFPLLCAGILNKWLYPCCGVARVLIKFFKMFFSSRDVTWLVCTFGPMRSEDRTNVSLHNQSDSKCQPARCINGPARPNGKHMSVSANLNCFTKWWVQYGLSVLLWLLRILFQLRTHIQRLNRENKEILVVIDFPVTCELESSHLIHFVFVCVCSF